MTDVAVVGSGPNGLAAAVTMARAGLKVHVFEAAATPGGGLRTAELMEPGHFHDVCSAVHPMALASPFFRQFELSRRVHLEVPGLSYGSPLDGGRAALAYRSLDRTVAELGRDGAAYRRLMGPLVQRAEGVADLTLNQLLRMPRDPVAAAVSASGRSNRVRGCGTLRFREDLAPALLSGVAAHAVAPLPSPAAAGAGLMLGALAHAGGWPVPLGGSAAIAAGAGRRHRSPWRGDGNREADRVPGGAAAGPGHPAGRGAARTAALADGRLPARYRRALESFRFGNAACKVDFILSGPVPWAATDSPTPERSTWAAPGRKWPRRKTWSPRAGIRTGPMCWSPSLRASMPAARPPAGTSSGPIAMFRPVPRVDMSEAVMSQLERFAPGSGTWWSSSR